MAGNTLTQILATATHRLAQAGNDTPRLDAEVLLAHGLGRDRIWLYTHPQEIPTAIQLSNFFDLLSRREQREPVAYITGHKEFFALDFQVNQHVLIPRPETELLVETAIHTANQRISESADQQINQPTTGKSIIPQRSTDRTGPISIADIGTGSGCIAVALAKNIPEATLFAVDISSQALAVARGNAIRHNVADNIKFLRGDLLLPLPGPVDLVVSNPPYVSRSELNAASPEVRQYEPGLALDGGEDGLELIGRLLPQAREKLRPRGSLLVEIGSSQGSAVVCLAQKHFSGANIRLKQDLAGLDRLLVVELAE